ncbi:HAD family hydrolase [Novosphingobium sp. BL-8A]|uniref:D-glycero-alpha-D-manno-heptose-1,7-bisphosphate 7-phosphatase n=1 Tax=Novosphingobium sp. BL-8A TaxID=3127639 RepID=UPI003757A0FD
MIQPGAILLDRDGTIIVERDYLRDPTLVELEASAVEGLRKLTSAGWRLVVLTNQSGVARGYFDRQLVDTINAVVHKKLEQHGICVSGWFVCPHGQSDGCACRKPMPGLAVEASVMLGIDLKASWMIGDKVSDIALAQAIEGRAILVRTGHATTMDENAAHACNAWVADNLDEAAEIVLSNTVGRSSSLR